MCGLRCRRNWRALRRRRGDSSECSQQKKSDFTVDQGQQRVLGAVGRAVLSFSETSGDSLGGQNCPSAEEDCLDRCVLECCSVPGWNGEGAGGVARRGTRRETASCQI